MNSIGLYVHIPFCKSKCAYCNFTSFSCHERMDDYLDALDEEISRVLNKDILIDTLYIGGGTPSILDAEKIENIISKVKECAKFEPREVTIECNPESLTEDKVVAYKNMGITRISMGVQSLNDKTLKAIGRIHKADDAIYRAKMIKSHDINLSVDMIVGLPYSNLDDIRLFVDTFSSIGVNHISCYSLSVEEGTPLDKMVRSGKIVLPSEDEQLDQYDLAYTLLNQKDYHRYEISNFALVGYESQHNNKYWQMDEYIGVGLASHSFINGKRYYNTSDIDEYISLINDGKMAYTIDEVLTSNDMIEETIMLGLRMERGLEIDKVNKLLHDDFVKVYQKNLDKVKDYITIDNGYIAIKPEFMNVMNTIIVDIIG